MNLDSQGIITYAKLSIFPLCAQGGRIAGRIA